MSESSSELTLDVLLYGRELENGDLLLAPAAAIDLVSYGHATEAHAEQSLFLPEYLADVRAEALAKFTLAEGTELRTIDVVIPRDDLEGRSQIRDPIALSAVLIPQGEDTWVFLPRLGHTFFCAKKDDLRASIESEARRIAAVQELDASSYLALLPGRREWLEPVRVAVERPGRDAGSRARRRALIEEQKRKHSLEVLRSIGLALHERPEAKAGPPLVGRQDLLDSISPLLSSKERQAVLLVGPELVGKSAIILAWLRAEKAAGRERLVFVTSGAQLIAGMSALGQWQERLQRVMTAAEHLDATIYFDNLSDLFGDRSTSSVDLAGAFKPYLEEAKVRVIGELSPEALSLFEGRHVGFFSYLTRFRVQPLDARETFEVLSGRVRYIDDNVPDQATVEPDALQTLIDLADRYLPYRPFPGKAVRFLEQLRASHPRTRDETGRISPINSDDVLRVFSIETGIPSFLLREDRALRAEKVIEFFGSRLIGQAEAVRRVVDTICVVKAGLQPAGKPLATFLFIGPTGVGKTELARSLATFLFGSEERMVRFDMSEYMDAFAAERLIRGTDDQEGLLTRRVRQQPFGVLLLDEIEKAHPAVFDLLLQVCGEGRLTDVKGRTAYFHNAIIIMTSNLGAADRRAVVGIGESKPSADEHYLEQAHRSFRPEFVNRLDQIISFRELTPRQVEEVARMAVSRIASRRGLAELGVELDVSEGALTELATRGYSELYGARALRRHLEDHLVSPASRLLASAGPDARGARLVVRTQSEVKTSLVTDRTVLLTSEQGGLTIRLHRGAGPGQKRDLRSVAGVSARRREVARHMELDQVEQLDEHIKFLVSQMAQAPSDRRTGPTMAALHKEHYRLSRIWEALEGAKNDMEVAEELALSALYESVEVDSFIEESVTALERFEYQLVYALIAFDAQARQISLRLREPDDGQAMQHWLAPLVEACPRRGWTATVHLPRNFSTVRDPEWPKGRFFGPAEPMASIVDAVRSSERGWRDALVRVEGEYAGILMALEAGVHRFSGVHPEIEQVHMLCHRLCLRTQLTDDEWLSPELRPAISAPAGFTKARAVRHFDRSTGRVEIGGSKIYVPVALGEYWARFERIALAHLLLYEADGRMDRSELSQGELDRERGST